MTAFPGSPRLIKGALLSIDTANPRPSVIVFQYNPDTLTRSLTPQASGATGNPHEALRLQGPPQETIQLEIELDATDQLEQAQPRALALGIYPSLAALEMLLYPRSALVLENEVLLRLGIIEVIPPEAPLTLLVWGARRIVPVRVTQMSITEEAFDPQLNPMRARVSLNVQVLTYQDLGLQSVGGALFMAHQVLKEVMASLAGNQPATALPATLPSFLRG